MATTLILLFVFALVLSLAFVPVVRIMGIKLGAMDLPQQRKVHTRPIPRIGGVAVFISFLITSLVAITILAPVPDPYIFNSSTAMGLLGLVIVFACGLWDDFRRLKAWKKLCLQIAAATIAFIGGASINSVSIAGYSIEFNIIVSYAITIFWFLLFINAVNLIDGLDGLAGGLVLFTCLVMIYSTYMHGDYLSAFYFTALAGAVMGFLKYNFNPASIFLGDGGSYFLGYVVAFLAIHSSSKCAVGALMLIPLLALGVPIFDSILSPLRRFVRGRSIFRADKGHIHHIFLSMGLSSRNAVLLIYGISLGLCILAILMITYRGEKMLGVMLGLLLFGMIYLVRKLGYLEYLAFDKFYGWFRDINDVSCFSKSRRSFLSLQIDADKSSSLEELWTHVGEALEMLKFDWAELHSGIAPVFCWKADNCSVLLNPSPLPSMDRVIDHTDSLLRMEIPLINEDKDIFGTLIVIKDINQGYLKPYTIRRVEHLRRTLLENLTRLKNLDKIKNVDEATVFTNEQTHRYSIMKRG